MIGYLVTSWNPWDCQLVNKKLYLSIDEARNYIDAYKKDTDEVLEIAEVEIGD